MYHHHSQQHGSQSFSNVSRPPHHQPPPNQHQNHSSNDALSQAMGFQFPRPTQLPDELESALAIRGTRDMDHRLIDHTGRPTQHQNQSPAPGISQHGSFGSNSMALASENQPAHQQGVDWSSYQPPSKLFSSPPAGASHQSQRPPGPQQQPQGGHTGARIQSWKTSDSQLPQASHPLGSGDNQGMYTPESAGSILASFGLSNEDLEVLSHYPDDQLTPDTLPFILRDIQINKTGPQNTAASASSPSFTSGIQEIPLLLPCSSHSPEVPSLLTVTQTAGKVIDYGHASRAKEKDSTRKTFKREQLSTERTVKMYPTSLQSSPTPKPVKAERQQVRLEHTEPSKHGDQDYRRKSSDHRKINRSPAREFQPFSKPLNLDQDYRRDAPKPRPSSETRKEASSRRSLSSSSGSKLQSSSSSKRLPTPTMISDFSAVSPKVYPHTCSLCHTQCDQEKDWVDHINTVNHTAACRDLRNKYPDWKPYPPSGSGQQCSRGSWDPNSPSRSVPRSVSCSLSPSPPHSKHRPPPPHHRAHGRAYLPHNQPHYQPRHQRNSGVLAHSGLKRTHDESTKISTDASRHPSSSRAGHSSKHGLSQSSPKTAKSGIKPVVKTTKTASGKTADSPAKPPPAKKKKKVGTPAQDSSVADRLVYLTGIPNDASEQEVTDLVGSFGRINNVILMPCSEEDSEKSEGQKASVCMMKAEDARALANSTNLSIREQHITTSTAKKPEEKSSSEDNSKPAPGAEKGDAREGAEADLKTSEERGLVLITGLPEGGWSESDIFSLVQQFGTPFDIIMATQIGRVLLSVSDLETAQEMVKVHSFRPAKIRDSEVKMTHIKQNISLSTPVALYNLLMASGAPFESPASVGWSSLLVISNVPSTPSGRSEVQKLVRRFGTVIKTLVLNNMVICEMATAAMALSVYKRFQTFPCIIHNNPLFFSRKADPRASTQSKVITAYLDPTEETPASGKSSKTSAALGEETNAKDHSSPPLEVTEKHFNGQEEKTKSAVELLVGDKALKENQSKDQGQEVQKEELRANISESLAVPDAKPIADSEASQIKRAEKERDGNASTDGREKSAAGEETKISIPDGGAASRETPVSDPVGPAKASLEIVNALREEGQISTVSKSNNSTEAPTYGKQEETQLEKKQATKSVSEHQQPAKIQSEEETKKQERELKEKEAKGRERKEREKKERERRTWESKERARKQKERDERARRERERKEEDRRDREKRERKKMLGEGYIGRRSSSRSDGNKCSPESDGQNKKPVLKKVKEEEESDEFPFNMSDFVTVDEVGDVTDLPEPLPYPAAAVLMETIEEDVDTATSVQKDLSEETPAEANAEAEMPHVTATPVKSAKPEPGAEAVKEQASSASDQLSDSPHCQTVPTCQPAAPETETKQTPLQVGSLTMPDDSSTNPEEVKMKSEGEEENDFSSQVEEEKEREKPGAWNKTEESGKILVKEKDKARSPAGHTGKYQRLEDPEEESMRKKLKTETPTNHSLPPFDPSNPVGLEFLVQKTGFFCKVCNRFFSGNKEIEISHCKTLKHYENLQKFLQSRKSGFDFPSCLKLN